jgi:hypothetical protein
MHHLASIESLVNASIICVCQVAGSLVNFNFKLVQTYNVQTLIRLMYIAVY